MRFEEEIHWSEGLFLQPHHLQSLQRGTAERQRIERSLYLHYPFGLKDFELDYEALNNQRVVLKRFSVIMKSGVEISMPGNCVIAPLDFSEQVRELKNSITIYIALPYWSKYDANLTEKNNLNTKHQFYSHDKLVRDENSGENEIPLTFRLLNAFLTTNFHNNNDLELLPIAQIKISYQGDSQFEIKIDDNYIAPFLQITTDCPLFLIAQELNIQLQQRRNKIIYDLTAKGYVVDNLAASDIYNIMQLKILNSYEGRLSSLLITNSLTPFELYLELKSLLGELSALQPLRDFNSIAEYNHLNYGEIFKELCANIRSLIMIKGISSYIRLDFQKTQIPHKMLIGLKDDHIALADEYFLAVSCSKSSLKMVEDIENGDNFKLINPNGTSARIRGVKLTEMRYPPRFLPAIPNATWFKFERNESNHIWSEICKERGILLDWAQDLYPNLEATIYITTLAQGD